MKKNFLSELGEKTANILTKNTAVEHLTANDITISPTLPTFKGDYTIVLFPLIKKCNKTPQELAEVLQNELPKYFNFITDIELVKGFLNIVLSSKFWLNLSETLFKDLHNVNPAKINLNSQQTESVLIEYPSPNTNKPLHFGHLRNIFLGSSLAKILRINGYKVYEVCLYNDRGTNISKSMYAYLQSGAEETPESSGIKGDKLVGNYYVEYNAIQQNEVKQLQADGLSLEDAKAQCQSKQAIADLTLKWEAGDAKTVDLWKKMNAWFYTGVEQTYQLLDLHFDTYYYESKIYKKGKDAVALGLKNNIFYKKEDGSVWVDLHSVGLDNKLILRNDGTSVYITQDIALAMQKKEEFDFSKSVYVVGNEQDYHFKVLFEILRQLNVLEGENLHHLSYGMVTLPSGKMKSREGTTADADDVIADVIKLAKEISNAQGKLSALTEKEREKTYQQIGLCALRYFILKVDPAKNMLFDPSKSIDFTGNTGPFIQYTYARTQSLQRKAREQSIDWQTVSTKNYLPDSIEIKLLRLMLEWQNVLKESAMNYNPAVIANYTYEVGSMYSNYYHDYPVLHADNKAATVFRLKMAAMAGSIIKIGMYALGADVPERM